MSATTSILVARQLAALRGQGLSTLDALAFVSAPLPPGELKQACERALVGLRAGQAQANPGASTLEQTCAAGDAATAERFEVLAEALEARDAAARALHSALRFATVLVAGPLVLGCLAGWVVDLDDYFRPMGASLPAPTEALLSLLAVLRWAGVPLALGAVVGLRRAGTFFAPGRRAFEGAALLLELASGVKVELSPALFDDASRRFFEWRRAQVGDPQAARELARELLDEAVAQAARFETAAPVAAAVAALLVAQTLFLALYLPIFSIAGAIK